MQKKLLTIVCAVSLMLAFAGCGGNADGSSQNSSSSDSLTCTHIYDNDCDATCNECGEGRTPAEHVYDGVCDTDCNECGGTRTADEHTYDNACDADCNVCGSEREVPEDPVNGGNWTGEVPLS